MNRIYIGDNLTLLEKLKNKYLNSIQMIYIDPPYNTKTKKSYVDSIDSDAWQKQFSSRIKASYDYLTKQGVIFISIDDSEFCSVRKICDEVFGKKNFVGTFITRQSQRSNARLINVVHEYIVVYAKSIKDCPKFSVRRMDIPEQREIISTLQQSVKEYSGKDVDKYLHKEIKRICKEYDLTWLKNYASLDAKRRIYFPMDLSVPGTPRTVDIPNIGLHLKPLKTRSWASDKTFVHLFKKKRLVFKGERPYEKKYLTEAEDNAPSILNFYSRQGTHDLAHLGLQGLFDTPKPIEMIKFLIRLCCKGNKCLIMDFYAGSGTTAQAVYEINEEDNKNHSFLLMQRKEAVKDTKIQLKCAEIGLKPYISDILIHRINTFLKKKGMNINYKLKKLKSV